MHVRSNKNKMSKALVAGALGGLAASWTMTRFQYLLARAMGKTDPHEGEEEDATVKTARKISCRVANHELSAEEKKKAGPLVHYAYGTGIGMLYSGLSHRTRKTTSGFGTAYGAAAWVLGDEVAVPALSLGKKPAEIPVSQHLQYLAAHLVYGLTLEGVRRLTLRVL